MAVYKDEKNMTKDGRKWYFKVYKKDVLGNLKEYKSKKYASRQEAKEAEALFLLKRDNPIHKPFLLVASDYFKHLKATKKASTYDTRLRDYKKHIEPFFKNFEIDNINIMTLKNWKEEIEKKNYSLEFSNKLYTTLSNILDFAISNYGLPENLLKKIGRFQKKNDEVVSNEEKLRYITLEQFNKFIACVNDDMWQAFFYFAYYTGCRKGEIVALKWTDIDFDNRIIHINKTLYSKIKGLTKENVVVNNTKNSLNRDIKMSSLLYNILTDYKKKVSTYKDFNENWYVFGNTMYLTNTTIDRAKDEAFRLSGVTRITMHEFRHSHVSLLINEYIKSSKEKSVKVDTAKFFLMMSERMGHSIPVMEKIYMHLFPTVQDEIIDLLDNL